MADLDLFKKVNDTYGHDAGDTVLRSFAEILKANTRQSNICARLGGEEFIVMISHADQKGTRTTADRIRKQLESKEFTFGKRTFTVTASFGVAGFCGTNPPDLNALVARADTEDGGEYSGSGCIMNPGCGTVFKITTEGVETVLYSFQGGPADGAAPMAGLVFDKDGNLYGTTYWGGSSSSSNCANYSCGTVFEVTPEDAC